MKEFMDKDFLLSNDTAKILYHQYAKQMPIFDFHNHLSAKEIYEDNCYNNLTEVWLNGDHYKWRAMRTNGIDESLITNKQGDPYERYTSYVDTIINSIGNPLYHWTHLELQRYFHIYEPLTHENEKEVWDKVNGLLASKEYSTRNLLRMQNVKALCTTDDPIDDLYYHKKLQEEEKDFLVLPAFRPDQILNIEKDTYNEYVQKLGECTNSSIETIDQLEAALIQRLEYFKECNSLVSDHSLEQNIYYPATKEEVQAIFIKKLNNKPITNQECAMYRGYILIFLAKQYTKYHFVMQFHIGALRNINTLKFNELGPDTGFDGMNDFNYAPQISELMNQMQMQNGLPKTVLYCLNAKDNDMLITLCGHFQDGSCKGKIQFGAPWWFNDHKGGMEKHFEQVAQNGLLSAFIGMLTDSRSFLSFPRHEYFRRILCNKIGTWVENGEYPNHVEYLGQMVQNICYNNASAYFELPDKL